MASELKLESTEIENVGTPELKGIPHKYQRKTPCILYLSHIISYLHFQNTQLPKYATIKPELEPNVFMKATKNFLLLKNYLFRIISINLVF